MAGTSAFALLHLHFPPVITTEGQVIDVFTTAFPFARLDALESDGMSDGMPIMTHRTTFALDATTAKRLKRLAARWHVSQAEVVRRSVEQAEKQTEAEKPDPAAMLRELFATGGGLDLEKGNAYIAEVYEDRKHWRGE